MFKVLGKEHLPQNLKKAVSLMVLYAITVFIGNLWIAFSNDFSQSSDLLRGLIYVAAILGLSWWLMSFSKLAWLISLIMCGISIALSMLSLVFFSIAGTYLMAIVEAVPTYLLVHLALILLSNETRKHFQPVNTA